MQYKYELKRQNNGKILNNTNNILWCVYDFKIALKLLSFSLKKMYFIYYKSTALIE